VDGAALENRNCPTAYGVRPNEVSAPIKYITGASNGDFGEIFGKLILDEFPGKDQASTR
jgi:hypothetical protein